MWSHTYARLLGNQNRVQEMHIILEDEEAIHVTGRKTYLDASNKANELFGSNYDWVENFENLTKNPKEILYSTVAYFPLKFHTSYRLNFLFNTDNVGEVTLYINGGSNGLADRQNNYNILRQSIFSCQQ